jgi:hypothetical protein
MAVSGVRSSWLTFASRSDFIRSSSFSSSLTPASFLFGLLQLLDVRLEARRHVVEGLGQDLQLVAERMLSRRSKWPSGQLLGARRQLRHRPA